MPRERTPELFAPILAEATGGTAKLQMYGRIDPDGAPWGISAGEFGDVLAGLPDDVATIDLHIHSRGGDVFDALAIVQQLRDHPAKVHATVDGLAASAASFIATACDTVTMTPDSSMMIHDARALVIDVMTASETQKLQTRLVHANDKIAAMYARKAGGTVAEWLEAMDAESWYSADEAVQAGLADSKIAQPVAEGAIAASLDLTTFAYDGRDHAPAPFMPAACRCGPGGATAPAVWAHKDECPTRASQTPAEPPVTPPTENKEADAMSDTENKGLRERLGLAEDADEATVLAKVDELLDQATKPDPAPAAAAEIPEGKVLVSQTVLDELKAGAQAGVEARAKQLAEERDETIQAAFAAGKISRDRVTAWTASWDKDPEGTKADLESLPARFPVTKAPGVASADADIDAAPFTDDEADALGALAGLPKGALR